MANRMIGKPLLVEGLSLSTTSHKSTFTWNPEIFTLPIISRYIIEIKLFKHGPQPTSIVRSSQHFFSANTSSAEISLHDLLIRKLSGHECAQGSHWAAPFIAMVGIQAEDSIGKGPFGNYIDVTHDVQSFFQRRQEHRYQDRQMHFLLQYNLSTPLSSCAQTVSLKEELQKDTAALLEGICHCCHHANTSDPSMICPSQHIVLAEVTSTFKAEEHYASQIERAMLEEIQANSSTMLHKWTLLAHGRQLESFDQLKSLLQKLLLDAESPTSLSPSSPCPVLTENTTPTS